MFMETAAREIIARRLAALYRRTLKLEEIERKMQPTRKGGPLPVVPFEEMMSQPIASRLDSVSSASGGLRYAAWCVGEALLALEGPDALHEVFAEFERLTDARGSSWLDHRWSGVTDGKFVWTP
jgi:hypothetical protein